jgi:3-hydroxybutyryl-CoA dehydratase
MVKNGVFIQLFDNSIYVSQSLVFKYPVGIGDHITAKVEVIAENDEKHRLTLKTTCENQDGTIVIDGEAIIVIMKIYLPSFFR